jgi:predicted lipoprotein
MKRVFTIAAHSLLLLTLSLFVACKKESDSAPDESVNGFNKVTMLTYYIDSIIIPRYAAMEQRANALETATNTFVAAPSPTTQAAVKTAYEDAHLQYERIAAFQFGPAETALLDLYMNYSGGLDYSFTTSGALTGFSVDSTTIESNITSGSYDLTQVTRASFYSQGFPALDYLFFAPNAISKYSSNTSHRVKYAQDVVARIKTLVASVSSGWKAYRTEFIGNTRTNVGSPIGNTVNQLAYQMDLLKGPRIGWPFGKQSNGIVFATKTEAYYTGNSVSLALENLQSLKSIYTAGGSGKGLSDYLVALNKAQLSTDITAQFDLAIAKLSAIPDPLSSSLVNNAASIDAAYKEIQKLLTLLKTDLASATAVQINYMDNDGD